MIDSHCHLYFDTYDGRREEIVREAEQAGVHTIVNIGIDLESSRKCIDLAERFAACYATVGVHPHDAARAPRDYIASLRSMASHKKVIAIGEIGLDFYRNLSPRPVQEKVFREQLELACELSMPIVIHTRESFEPTLEIVRTYADRLAGGVFHCFPGTADDAMRVIELGFVISVGGVITFPKASMAKTAAETPLDKIIIETDAPFLTPVPYRGRTNYPGYVVHTCRKLAELHGVSIDEAEKVTDRTCRKVYRLVETFGE
ncbi:TatD family hydrolase [bacterium]|nr:TatD family hydrolase [bacterium]